MSTSVKRFFESKYSLWLLEIGTFGALSIIFASFWIMDVSIDTQHVPEIMSGLTGATAILIGFTVTCLSIMHEYYAKNVGKLFIILTFLMLPVGLILNAYMQLIFQVDFIIAIQETISAFTISLMIVYVSLFLTLKESW